MFAREYGRFGVTANATPRARTRMTEDIEFFQGARGRRGCSTASPRERLVDRRLVEPDAAADVSGQVFIVIGGDVHLFRCPHRGASIRKGERWSIDEAGASSGDPSATKGPGVPPMAVPGWSVLD